MNRLMKWKFKKKINIEALSITFDNKDDFMRAENFSLHFNFEKENIFK